jgi:Domain of unknown function (DUF4282)
MFRKCEGMMLLDFLKFDQYLTPTIIRIFYFLQVALIVLFGLWSLFFAAMTLAYSPLAAIFSIIGTLIGAATAIIAARILTEIVMVLFQNNEHLAAMRGRMEGH